jgi:hypothetical protein
MITYILINLHLKHVHAIYLIYSKIMPQTFLYLYVRIYILKRVYIHANVDKFVTLILERGSIYTELETAWN